jgi:NAD(P)-dependent dehydrogenase (short-subunit alcohol dehydrogenase family)
MQHEMVCITGSGNGLGRSLAEAFLRDSSYMVAAITRNSSLLTSLKKQYGERCVVIEADICSEQGLGVIHQQISALGRIKILIHNAGHLVFKPFGEISADELRIVYEVNVFAPFALTQKLMPLFSEAHIINISSVGGVQGSMKFSGLSAYSSSKAALCCLTEMWSEEFKNSGHTFNCLALGSVDTAMFRSAFPGFKASVSPESMASYIVSFAKEAPLVMRGKILSLSLTNP